MYYSSKIKICCSLAMLGIDVNTIYITCFVPSKLLELVRKPCEIKLGFFNTWVIKIWALKVQPLSMNMP